MASTLVKCASWDEKGAAPLSPTGFIEGVFLQGCQWRHESCESWRRMFRKGGHPAGGYDNPLKLRGGYLGDTITDHGEDKAFVVGRLPYGLTEYNGI